jgi:hypothetical protein
MVIPRESAQCHSDRPALNAFCRDERNLASSGLRMDNGEGPTRFFGRLGSLRMTMVLTCDRTLHANLAMLEHLGR